MVLTYYQQHRKKVLRAAKLNYRLHQKRVIKRSNTRWALHKRKLRKYRKQHLEQTKNLIFNTYGNICACCKETNKRFLTIDHINNDGYKDRKKFGYRRKGISIYIAIKRENFPKDKYQLLCMNCNFGKARNNGICPHKEEENGTI